MSNHTSVLTYNVMYIYMHYTVAVTVMPEERDGTDLYPQPKKEEEEEVSGCGLKSETRANTLDPYYKIYCIYRSDDPLRRIMMFFPCFAATASFN